MSASKVAQSKSSASYPTQNIEAVVQQQPASYYIGKRIIDISGALIGIILLSWLFLIISIAIKVEDPKGPVFFVKSALEKTKKSFICLSFVPWSLMLKKD